MAKKVVTKELLEKSTQDILQSVVEHLYDFESYTDDEISALFSLTPEEAQRISDIISDNVISQYKLWSSKKTSDAISEAQIECNNYASELISNISSIKLEWCETALPSTGESNKIYILPVTSGSDTVNTLNLWDSTNSNWVVIGNLEIDSTQYYTKTEIDSKLDEKANKTEILSQDDIITTPDSATTANVLSAKTTVDELNNKLSVDKLSTVVDNLSTNDTVPTSKAVYDYIGTLNSLTGDIDFGNYNLSSDISTINVGDVIPFEKIDGTINISSGIATLEKGKSYLVSSVINVTADTSAFYDSYLSYALYLNDVEDSVLGITRPSISTGSISDSQITRVIKSDEDIELSVKIVDCDKVTNINKEYTKLSIIEIPNPTSIMNVTDEHIKNLASKLLYGGDLQHKADLNDVSELTKERQWSVCYYTTADANTPKVGTYGIVFSYTSKYADDYNQWVIDNNGMVWFRRALVTTSGGTDSLATATWTTKDSTIADVPTTTLTSFITSTISGNLYYKVTNGICYVSICPLQNTVVATDIDVCSLPKPLFSINQALVSNTSGTNIGLVWMNPDTILKARFFTDNIVGYATFSYPVAE